MNNMAPPGDPHPNADVRMRGFRVRASVDSALAWLDAQLPAVAKLPTESVPLARGRRSRACVGRGKQGSMFRSSVER